LSSGNQPAAFLRLSQCRFVTSGLNIGGSSDSAKRGAIHVEPVRRTALKSPWNITKDGGRYCGFKTPRPRLSNGLRPRYCAVQLHVCCVSRSLARSPEEKCPCRGIRIDSHGRASSKNKHLVTLSGYPQASRRSSVCYR